MFERLDSRSDVLTEVLDAVRLGSALSSRVNIGAPWALHYGAADRRAGFHVVVSGRCWATLDGTVDGGPVALGPGDIVVFPHGTGHTLGDHPATPAVEFEDVAEGVIPPPGGGPGERATVLCGAYSFAEGGANPLLRGLPPMLHVPADPVRGRELRAAVDLLAAEGAEGADGPAGGRVGGSGSALVVDRLVDLLFVYALRTWLDQHDDAGTRSWFGALHDPVVGPAVRAVHDDPARPWTVAELAERSGLSRAPFARRFRQAVGEPPLAYVTRWRMTVAAGLLERGERIAGVAHQVGYGNEFAFAKAFKRVRGVAPGDHRRRHAR